ncbi:MAG: hypothetical protein RLZZ58_845, partial [Pseudomonadota bacterium]
AVERTWLAGWLDRLRAAGADVAAAVPMAALIPAPADERALRSMAIGAAGAVRGAAHGFADDPALVLALGGGTTPDAMASADVAAALAAAIDRPPLDMLTGPFRRRAKGVMTPGRRRLMAQLVAALLIISLLVPLVQMVRWSLAAGQADDASLALAARLGITAPDAAGAETALDARLAARGGGPLALSVPLSALISALQPVPGAAIQALSHRADGTLSATLAAPRVEDINAVLLALQARGYRVTAQPMTGADGLQKGSVTIRAVP